MLIYIKLIFFWQTFERSIFLPSVDFFLNFTMERTLFDKFFTKIAIITPSSNSAGPVHKTKINTTYLDSKNTARIFQRKISEKWYRGKLSGFTHNSGFEHFVFFPYSFNILIWSMGMYFNNSYYIIIQFLKKISQIN